MAASRLNLVGLRNNWRRIAKVQTRHASSSQKGNKLRLEKAGINIYVGPDGRRLPIPNTKKIYPREYPCLVVNRDGSTYWSHAHYPYQIITLPLDPSSLSQEERDARAKLKQVEKTPKYYSLDDHLEGVEEEAWDHAQYKDLLR